jgi:lipid II:glycine glycyltransferase (peptidoglycan interpeptide bridge formation enzyme)
VIPNSTQAEWDSFLSGHPEHHLLQSNAWGELKSSFGWSAHRIIEGNCGAQVLFRSLPLGYTIAYIPKGPVGSWIPDLLPVIDNICHEHKAIFLRVEPDHEDNPELVEKLRSNDFRRSHQTIQPRQTLIVDVQGSEDEILGRMRQKTRYNIRLAGRKGVKVRPWDDVDGFTKMILETGIRDEFGVHSPEYYKQAYELFHPQKICELFVAEFDHTPLAAIFVFTARERAWYLYGASTAIERNRMPTYLLQWEAMKWAAKKGCNKYDLWGIPAEDEETLERNFTSRSDGLWGVYRFKRGFGGKLHRTIGAWDRAYNRPLYSLYRMINNRSWNSR